MLKLLFATLLALPSMLRAQAIPMEQRSTPAISLTASGAYVFNDAQYGHNRSWFGWSVVPDLNFTRHLGLEADFASFYIRSIYPGQSRLILAAGPRYILTRRPRVSSFVFAEGGEMRLSSQRTLAVDWNPVAKGGFGLEYRVTPGFALTLVPGEYLGQIRNDGSWNHSYSTRVGFTFNMYR
jgi:hypothetical protein